MIRILLLFFVFLFSLWFGDATFAADGGGGNSTFTLDSALEHLDVKGSDKPKYQAGVNDTVTGEATDTTNFLNKIGKSLVVIITSVAIFMVTYNALSLVMAAGSQDKISKAKKALVWILLGLLSVMAAYIIVKTVITLPFAAG